MISPSEQRSTSSFLFWQFLINPDVLFASARNAVSGFEAPGFGYVSAAPKE